MNSILHKYVSVIRSFWDEGTFDEGLYGFINKLWAFLIVDLSLFVPAVIISLFNSESLLLIWMLIAVPAFVLWLIIKK